MELLKVPQPRMFVMCRLPLSDTRVVAPAKVWHTCLVVAVREDFDGKVFVTLAGTTSKVTGRKTRVTVRAASPEGHNAGAKNDFEICPEWVREVPLSDGFFGDKLTVKGTMGPRLASLLSQAVANLAKLS